MRSQPIIGLSALLLLCAVSAQQTYDGRNGPHVFGKPGEQVYIRGQNPGPYKVPGVEGTFQNTPAQGGAQRGQNAGASHVYTDEDGTTYVNQRNGGGRQATHSISGPGLQAYSGGQPARRDSARETAYRTRRGVVVSRPDRVVVAGGPSTYVVRRNRRDFHVSRPDRTVDVGSGGFVIQRSRRSPQNIHVTRADGRTVSANKDGFFAQGKDGRTVAHSRHRRARVQGENFVARDDQAGVWNDNVSVWKRPDGRTVSVDSNGNVITSGSPNGRGPQRYSG